MTGLFFSGAVLCFVALGLGMLALRPLQSSVPLDRRRSVHVESDSQLSRFAGSAVLWMEAFLRRHPQRFFRREVLETAGVRLSQADVFILVTTMGATGLVIGWVLVAPVVGLLLLVLSPAVAHLILSVLTGRRRKRFESQLGDTLQLLTGGLRAGHSILRAIDAAATEADSPTAEEMRRIVAETSLGKDLLTSLLDTSKRMASEDFAWVAQAIQINREVGGDLADVLDQVGHTIRERSEIKGQIKSLAAEGKITAYILGALPIGITFLLTVISPGYVDPLFSEPLGLVMVGGAVCMMVTGCLWLRKIIDLKF